MMQDPSTIAALDRAHVWHPYEPRHSPNPQIPVASTEGTHITLHDGTRLIDGMSSWLSLIHI